MQISAEKLIWSTSVDVCSQSLKISRQHDLGSFSKRLVTKTPRWSSCKCLSTALKSVAFESVGEPLKKAVRLAVGSVGKKRWKKIATRWNFLRTH